VPPTLSQLADSDAVPPMFSQLAKVASLLTWQFPALEW